MQLIERALLERLQSQHSLHTSITRDLSNPRFPRIHHSRTHQSTNFKRNQSQQSLKPLPLSHPRIHELHTSVTHESTNFERNKSQQFLHTSTQQHSLHASCDAIPRPSTQKSTKPSIHELNDPRTPHIRHSQTQQSTIFKKNLNNLSTHLRTHTQIHEPSKPRPLNVESPPMRPLSNSSRMFYDSLECVT